MNFVEFLSPLRRQKWLFMMLSIVFALGLFGVSQLIPQIEKTTIFFTVKPVSSAEKSFVNDGVESAERVAEMIAGWAKDPNFLQQIQDEGSVKVEKLKKKISARKQNRLNVFWTLKLTKNDSPNSYKIATGLNNSLIKKIDQINAGSAVPIQITPPQIFSEFLEIPQEWIILSTLFISFFLAGFGVYGRESLRNKISFFSQIRDIFPKTPILQMNGRLDRHDKHQLELFLNTFENPRLISTFPAAGKFFELVDPFSLAEEETPILLVKMGETSTKELENNLAIFGDEVGIIVFEE